MAQEISIKDKKIKVVKNWPEPKLVRSIQVFLSFANFYYYFIQNFSKIIAPFTSILKTLSPLFKSQSTKIADKVDDEIVEDGNKSGNTIFTFKKLKNIKSKNLTFTWDLGAMEEPTFLISGARKAFN